MYFPIYYSYFCNTYEYAVILRLCSAQCSPAGRGRGASGPVASGIGEFLSGGGWDQLCDRHLGADYIAMDRSTIFNGKIHYFYGHFPLLC